MKVDFNNPTTLLDLYKKLAIKYPNSNVIITLEEHGAMYLDNNQIKVMPGLKLENIKDSNGAGAIFRAAFVAGLSRGYEIEKNIRIANIAAGLSLQKIGAKNSIPLFSDVANYYEKKFGPIGANNLDNQQTETQSQVNVQNNETQAIQTEETNSTTSNIENEIPKQEAPLENETVNKTEEVTSNDSTK